MMSKPKVKEKSFYLLIRTFRYDYKLMRAIKIHKFCKFTTLKKLMEPNIEQLGQSKKKVKTQQKPLKCLIQAESGFARALTLTLPHGDVLTPVYMPVGTKGTMKGITSRQMETLDCRILLSNTYHLGNLPGEPFLGKVGGLHKFMSWNRNILTDSGGFQMVSLCKLCQINQEGVQFQNPYNQSKMFIRPEDSIHIQNTIGSDIMMALDDVVKTTTVGPRMEEAMERTIRWIDRNLSANVNPSSQSLFPIVQGGIDPELRKKCLQALITKDANGYAIGGLAGGQAKSDFFKIVRLCCEHLPKDKPRYVMGVGYPIDIILGAIQGVDMFDCVFPTRTARFGTAFTRYGEIKIKKKQYSKDFGPIEQGCQCEACTHFSRAYLQMIQKHDNFCHLLSMHNINFNFTIMKRLRKAIAQQRVSQYLTEFINNIYTEQKKIPSWVKVALEQAKIDIELKFPYFQAEH